MTTKSKAEKSRSRTTGAADYTTSAFIKRLELTAESCFFDASQFKSASGSRRSKWVMRDRVFRAIANLRRRGRLEEFIRQADARPKHDYSNADEDDKLRIQMLEAFFSVCREELANSPDPEDERFVAQEFVNAVKEGHINRLKDLVGLCDLYEKKKWSGEVGKRGTRSWSYYTALAAARVLRKGVIPTKKTLREVALLEAAFHEYSWLGPIKGYHQVHEQKRKELRPQMPTKRSWARILKRLGLSDLPSASTH